MKKRAGRRRTVRNEAEGPERPTLVDGGRSAGAAGHEQGDREVAVN